MKQEDCHIKKIDGLVFSAQKLPSGRVQINGFERHIEGGFWKLPLPLRFREEKRFFKEGAQALMSICEISEASAQFLFNRLWDEGFRPLEGEAT